MRDRGEGFHASTISCDNGGRGVAQGNKLVMMNKLKKDKENQKRDSDKARDVNMNGFLDEMSDICNIMKK